MKLQSQQEADNTREKLRSLEEHYEEAVRRPCDNEHIWELTLQSLKRTINQMKEEIAVFECHACSLPTVRQ